MKKILLLLLAFPLLAMQCEAETETMQEPVPVCDCEKRLYYYTPAMGSGGTISIPARYDFVRSIPNQCGETTQWYEQEYGEDYNRYLIVCP